MTQAATRRHEETKADLGPLSPSPCVNISVIPLLFSPPTHSLSSMGRGRSVPYCRWTGKAESTWWVSGGSWWGLEQLLELGPEEMWGNTYLKALVSTSKSPSSTQVSAGKVLPGISLTAEEEG